MRGGARQGAGRPPIGKMRSIRMSDEEYDKVRKLLKEWRKDEKTDS